MADDFELGTSSYLARAADKIPSMLAYWGHDQRCRYANCAYAVWFGVEPSALVGGSIRDLLGEELFALNEPYIKRALAGQPQTFERDIPGPDGVVRRSLVHYIPDIGDGRVLGFVAQVTDVTTLMETQAILRSVILSLGAEVERHHYVEERLSTDQRRLEDHTNRTFGEKVQFEQALQEVNALVYAIEESVVDHIAVLDRHGFVTATNSSWREFAVLCGEDACGPVPRSDVGANYLVECRDVVGAVSSAAVQAAEGVAAVLAGQQELFTLEYTHPGPAGERWFHMRATRLQSLGGGAVIVHAEITAGRKDRVRAHESRFDVRFDH